MRITNEQLDAILTDEVACRNASTVQLALDLRDARAELRGRQGTKAVGHEWEQTAWEYDFGGFTCKHCKKHVTQRRGIPAPSDHGTCANEGRET